MLAPPAMSTFPLSSNVAVCAHLATVMLPAVVNVPAVGSYSSASACISAPAIRTFPFGSKVAVWERLAAVMLPVTVNVPAPGSKSSALARVPSSPLAPPSPPTTSTFPLGNKVAVWPHLV